MCVVEPVVVPVLVPDVPLPVVVGTVQPTLPLGAGPVQFDGLPGTVLPGCVVEPEVEPVLEPVVEPEVAPVLEPAPLVGCVPTPTEPCVEFPVPLELPSMGVGFLLELAP